MKKGYTLIEVMISLLIFSIVLPGIFLVMNVGRSSWYSGNARIELQQELRKAIAQISDDLKQSSVSKIYLDSTMSQTFPNDGVAHHTIAFKVDQGVNNSSGVIIWSSTPVSYNLTGNQILRSDGVNPATVVANKITGLNFTRQSSPSLSNIIFISVSSAKTTQLGQPTNASIDTAAAVRN
jgi:prepilin-type N-terminal cleavage/methylation domain-containing protein